MLKNKVITVFISFLLVFTLSVSAEEGYDILEQIPQENMLETIEEPLNNSVAEPPEINLPKLPEEKLSPAPYNNPYKKPVSKKSVAKKFILAMLGVAFSSFIIYFGLTLYNKIREGFVSQQVEYKYDAPTLETPKDAEDAVRSFLERTNW